MLYAPNYYGETIEYQGYVSRIGDTAIYRHINDTDTLDAIVLSTGPWTADGSIVGDNSAEPTKYVFAGLADDTAYEVRIRAGASPAMSDLAIAVVPVPVIGLFPIAVLTPEQDSGACGKVITIVQGDDYTDVRKLPIEIDSVADLVGQYVIIAIKRSGEIGVSFRSQVYIGDDTKQYFDINMPSDTTSQMGAGDWQYNVRLESEISKESRISSGIWRVIGFATPVPVQGTER